jgi:hypothetical protein
METQIAVLRRRSSLSLLFDTGDYPDQYRVELIERSGSSCRAFGI